MWFHVVSLMVFLKRIQMRTLPSNQQRSLNPSVLGVFGTLSDSSQSLNFAKKNDSFNIRFNIALLKIQFKILFNSKEKLWKRETLVIQFNKISFPLENQGIVQHYWSLNTKLQYYYRLKQKSINFVFLLDTQSL